MAESINIIIKNGAEKEVKLKVKKTTLFKKIFAAYNAQMSTNFTKFTFDGDHIKEEQTPEDIGLEDGDQMEAIMEQTGGASGLAVGCLEQ